MARSAGIVVDNNLSGGLVTEATGLNFPENAATETWNCVFDKVGGVTRRNGFMLESGAVSRTVTKTSRAIVTYVWKNVGDTGERIFVVVQVGLTLYLYESGSGSLSSGAVTSTINLSPLVVGGGSPETIECSFSSGLGYLFITHPNLNPAYIEYTGSSFTLTALTIQIRDFEGLNDGLEIGERPNSLSLYHQYNLYNQGWYQRVLNAAGLGSQVLNAWSNDGRTTRGDYPSNADVWWYYKGPFPFGTDDVIGSNSAYFRNVLVSTLAVGNSPAPKGHYVLSLHYQDRSTVSELPGIPVQTTGSARVSCNAFFAGRVFYSGLNQDKYMGKIYFTQIIERPQQLGMCYQQMDPTSEQNSDLLPSDGGVISIAECGRVIRMQAVGNALIVWASNGVWSITGSEGIGFRANDYSVNRISSIPTLSASNFVEVEGSPLWWNTNGIYTLAAVDQFGGTQVQDLTTTKIKSFIDDIPIESKRYIRGAYNQFTKTVQWLYSSTSPDSVTDRYLFDRVLVFDTQTGSFYPWTLPQANNAVFHGILVVDGDSTEFATENVVNSLGVVVTDAALEPVTVEGSTTVPQIAVFKYLIGGSNTLTFAETRNLEHEDWADISTAPFDSYFDLGWKIHGEAIRKFQPTYIMCYSDNERATSYDIFGKWDWSNSGNTGRWSSIQRVISDPNTYTVSKKRLKIRGHGKALQIRVQSVDNDPFHVIGFSTFETGNQSP